MQWIFDGLVREDYGHCTNWSGLPIDNLEDNKR